MAAVFRTGRDRIRVGGLWLCDNTIWSGHVATATDKEGQDGVTAFIRERNRLVAEDTRYVEASCRFGTASCPLCGSSNPSSIRLFDSSPYKG